MLMEKSPQPRQRRRLQINNNNNNNNEINIESTGSKTAWSQTAYYVVEPEANNMQKIWFC